jgi:hypothetical protein
MISAKGRTLPKKRPEETPEQRKSRIEKTAAERNAAHLTADKAMDDRVKQNIEEHGA